MNSIQCVGAIISGVGRFLSVRIKLLKKRLLTSSDGLALCVGITQRTESGRLLMTYSEVRGNWTFPWGDVRDGESPESAAERIFREQTGLGARKLVLTHWDIYEGDTECHPEHEWFVYEATDVVGELQNRVSDTGGPTSYVSYFKPEEIREHIRMGRFDAIWCDHILNRAFPGVLKAA